MKFKRYCDVYLIVSQAIKDQFTWDAAPMSYENFLYYSNALDACGAYAKSDRVMIHHGVSYSIAVDGGMIFC